MHTLQNLWRQRKNTKRQCYPTKMQTASIPQMWQAWMYQWIRRRTRWQMPKRLYLNLRYLSEMARSIRIMTARSCRSDTRQEMICLQARALWHLRTQMQWRWQYLCPRRISLRSQSETRSWSSSTLMRTRHFSVKLKVLILPYRAVLPQSLIMWR